MSHKKRKKYYDGNILIALEKLPPIMKTKDNKDVIIRSSANNKESGKEHISKTSHGLQAKDILRIPAILRDHKTIILQDPVYKNRKNYYAEKRKKHLFAGYIKIVTEVKATDEEEIITIFFAEKLKQ